MPIQFISILNLELLLKNNKNDLMQRTDPDNYCVCEGSYIYRLTNTNNVCYYMYHYSNIRPDISTINFRKEIKTKTINNLRYPPTWREIIFSRYSFYQRLRLR